jgi:N-dimethylarginine dimethylaminohydrolase
MLAWPPDSLDFDGEADAHLMLEKPDLELARLQAEIIAETFEGVGVKVHWARPEAVPPPNFLFMRDLVFMTPEGAVLARPASPVRAGEARAAAECLAKAGIPILSTIHGDGLMEGADCLWLRPQLVLIGVGYRTNPAALAQLVGILSRLGVATRTVPVPRGAQHLLGVVVPLDRDLVVVDKDRCSRALMAVLEALEIQVIELSPSEELRDKRGMNLVTLGPRKILMPAECPVMRAVLESHGIEVHEAEVSEYVKAGGALGCLTAIIERDPVPELILTDEPTEEVTMVEAATVADVIAPPPLDSDEASTTPEEPLPPPWELEPDTTAEVEFIGPEDPEPEITEPLDDLDEVTELAEDELGEPDEWVPPPIPPVRDGRVRFDDSSESISEESAEESSEESADDISEDTWSPPSILQLGESADQEPDSTEVVVEWEDESDNDSSSD